MHNHLLTAALLALAACASTPDVERVIQAESAGEAGMRAATIPSQEEGPQKARSVDLAPRELTRGELRKEATSRLLEMDERCRRLLGPAREEDASYDELMAASRALIFNADLRIQADVAFRFDQANLPPPGELIDAEDEVPSSLKGEVRSLAQESRDLADRALELRPGDAAARLFSTLGIGLNLWSMGPLQALANGATTTLPKRIRRLAEDHPAFEGASPLRLAGRFQSRAPWPYKDKEGAVETLERAAETAPIPLNLLFLGDAYWIAGRKENATRTWERARTADADAETEIASPLLREIARQRVKAAAQ